MADISLVFPESNMEKAVFAFKQDFFDCGERTINGSYKLDGEKYSYAEWLRMITDNLHKETVDSRYGTSQTFFAIDAEQKIVGVITFRHELTDFYKDSGHIGYSVRPSERGKGYATEMLKQLLSIAREQGFKDILLTCKTDNIASQKVILKNSGEVTRAFSKNGVDYKEYCVRF